MGERVRLLSRFLRGGSILLLVAMVTFMFREMWRRKPETGRTKPLIQETPVDYGCLYTVYNPAGSTATKAWQTLSLIINQTTDPAQCMKGDSNNNNSTPYLIPGTASFRIQAFGSREMATGSVRHIGYDNYNATVRLTFEDEYIIMIILTYVNNGSLEFRSHVRPILQHVRGSPMDLKVALGSSPSDYTRYCTQKEAGTKPGRWVECGSVRGIESCGTWQLDPVYEFDQIHGFHWLPYDCQLHHYTNHEIKKCFAKRGWSEIVFTGDSHMRYRTYHWVTRLYGACHGCIKTHIKMVFDKIPRIEWMFDARGTRWPITFQNISLPNELYIHPRTRRTQFSKELPQSLFDGKLFILNFGHWVLRESTHTQFAEGKLRAYIEAIKAMNSTGGPRRFLWVNTVSLPWRQDKAVVEWLENPSPARVAQWNGVSDRIMRENGVQIVDAFQISNSRIGATHDQTHYAKRFERGDCGGVVENAISNTIANALCNFDI